MFISIFANLLDMYIKLKLFCKLQQLNYVMAICTNLVDTYFKLKLNCICVWT